MYSRILIPLTKRDEDLGMSIPRQPGSLANRIPRRSLRQVFDIPLSGEAPAAVSSERFTSFDLRRRKVEGPKVAVSAIPSSDRACRHNVFIDNGERLKKLDLPSTTSVLVSQRFEAARGDTLRFDYVVILNSKNRLASDRPSVRAVLVDLGTEGSVPLVNRSMDQADAVGKAPGSSRFRATQSFTVPKAGAYELRFVTFVDRHFPGSEAHLLVSDVRLLDRIGAEKKRLASLSCVGRVRQVESEEMSN